MTTPGSLDHHSIAAPATDDEDEEDDDDLDEEDEDDSIMEDDDDDTVVGTCLHCNAPPPPRSSSRSGGGSSSSYTGGAGMGLPCSGNSMVPATSTAVCLPVCPSAATRVQVSCDDCRSFICDGCHWCHEFQANHEIRVCDRCDAFYCRGCDEMDQCEDCSEVVCNTCSTLMSCKFCGCGLCEDCATACGRCGIVLCARDAKFAVECDTCRMSYCLVCLASGTKDPCVRCGHRPSKRVEQLVHLRLKSIYKAFKQSGASVGPGSGNGNGGGSVSSGSGSGGVCRSVSGDGRDGSTMGGKYSSALRSLTENVSDVSSGNDKFTGNFDQSMASEVAAVLQTASNSMANSDGEDARRSRGKRISLSAGHADHSPSPSTGGAAARNRSSSRASNAAAERYFRKTQAEMEAAAAAAEAEAEAAAEALLAELEEEQVTSKSTSKKSKKKKKKKEKKAAAVAELQQPPIEPSIADLVPSVDKKDDAKISQKKKGAKNKGYHKSSNKAPPPITDDDSSDEEMNFEQLVGGRGKSGTRPSKKDKKEEHSEAQSKTMPPPLKPKPEPLPPIEVATTVPATTADFDAELATLLSNEDEEGLETFLANLKGVPGLGAARKTAKKALKRIREARHTVVPTVEPEKPQTQSSSIANSLASNMDSEIRVAKSTAAKAAFQKQSSRVSSAPAAPTVTASTNPPPSTVNQHEPLLRVVSRTQSNVGTASSRGGNSNSSSNNNSTSIPASARAECVMHMSPAVVGWVIGKGGSRIRDMMEESGAKIWIDQESMGAKEARVVYVSGKRSSVDSAVRMVKDLVAKAPVAASAASSHVAPAHAPSSGAKSALAMAPASLPAVKNPLPLETAKEPTSFAAAIGVSTQPAVVATVTPPGPNPASPTKQPAPTPTQSWALPTQMEENNPVVPSPVAAPQSVQSVPQQPPVVNPVVESAGGQANLFHTDMLTAELACDPRFVALLIGRRGWTVKNIQAESGADLRIDQSREPPKIIISGRAEDVKRAERMVRDVLKYPHAQLHHQEVSQQQQQQPQPNNEVGSMDLSYSSRSEHSHVGDARRQNPSTMTMPTSLPSDASSTTNQSAMVMPTSLLRDVSSSTNPSTMVMPTSLLRDVSSSTPTLLDDLQLQESSRQPNFQQSYPHYQQQNQNNLGLFQDSSAVSRISEFLPNEGRQLQSAHVDPTVRTQSQESWGHHSQQAPSMLNQYSALPPFSGGQVVNTREPSYLISNPNAPSLAHQSPPRDNSRRPSSTFVLPPEHHLHFSQNIEASHQVPMPPAAQIPPTRINDFTNTGGVSSLAGNGWDLPTNGNTIGETWNQQSNHHNMSMSRSSTPHQQPGFQAQAVPPLSNNPFQQHSTQNHLAATTVSQPTNNTLPVSDDSLMVDNMFASLGTSVRDGDGGLLNALNSVSLGGALSQQGSNWESKISGWVAEESSSSSSLLQRSRLGDYRE